MLERFDAQRRKLIDLKKAEQQRADELCGAMFLDVGNILSQEGTQKRYGWLSILRAALNHESWTDPRILSPDEIRRYWITEKLVDLGNPDGSRETASVRLTAYGGNNPRESRRSFVSIRGVLPFIELRADYGVMWERTQDGHRTLSERGQRANIFEASFYRDVLRRFQALTNLTHHN